MAQTFEDGATEAASLLGSLADGEGEVRTFADVDGDKLEGVQGQLQNRIREDSLGVAEGEVARIKAGVAEDIHFTLATVTVLNKLARVIELPRGRRSQRPGLKEDRH